MFFDLPRDGRLLFITRAARLFSYGFISVILVLYLVELHFNQAEIGLLLTLTLIGDTVISLWLTTRADRIGRKKILIAGAFLMIFGGVMFALTDNILLLLIAATIGVISPSGNEVGPFLSVEQAALSHVIPNEERTKVFAWYTLAGSFATATGALSVGMLVHFLVQSGVSAVSSYRIVVICYACGGAILAIIFSRLTSSVEVQVDHEKSSDSPGLLQNLTGLSSSRKMVLKLSGLFAIDSFAGGFVIQSLMAYWLHLRFGAEPVALGGIFFGANVLAGLSALLAARIAERIGLINTMVFTHLPSNILLILVPLMPNLELAVIMLFLRFSISQMDVPTRQSYTMAVVKPEERSAAAGVTGVARTTGAAISPSIASIMLGSTALLSMPFFIAGGLKIIYDILLYYSFITQKPPEEK